MAIYSIIIIILLVLFLIEQKGASRKKTNVLFYISASLVFFIMAFRGENVGGDMIEYVHFWEGRSDMYGTYKIPALGLEYEPGISWLCHFMHLFNNGQPWFFVFFTSVLTLVPVLYLIGRDSRYKTVSVLFYMIMWGLLDITYTALRQVIGISLCLIAYILWTSEFSNKKVKIWLVIAILLLAISFHTVVYFCIPAYIAVLFIKKVHKKASVVTLLTSFALTFVFSNIVIELFSRVENFTSGFTFLFRYDQYFTNKYELNRNAIGLQQLVTTLIVCCIVIMSKEDDKRSAFTINSLVIGCSLLNIFASFPNAGRFLYPLLFAGIVSSPHYLNKKAYSIYKLVFLTLIMILSLHRVYYWQMSYADRQSDAYLYNQMFPYNFIWEDN